MNTGKLLLNMSAFVVGCALSGQAWAACSIAGGSAATAVEVAVGTLTVPATATVGTLLKTITVPDSPETKVICSNSGYYLFRYGAGTGRSAVTAPGVPAGVVSTGVDGIGVKVYGVYNSSFSDPYALLPGASGNGMLAAFPNYVYPIRGMEGVKIEFYKTGNITPGELLFPKNFIETWISQSSANISQAVRIGTLNISDSPDVKVPGCVTPSLTVPLGKHAKSDFSGVGSTSASTPFTFAINNCSAGLNAVTYTFKPATGITLEDSGLSTQHLTVKSGPGTASGIGVQVLYNNDTLVPFNTAISTTTGSHTIPMKARYIQTASAISAGDASSALEFTMTYQ